MAKAIGSMPKLITNTAFPITPKDVGVEESIGMSVWAMGFPFIKQTLPTLVMFRGMSFPSGSFQMARINAGRVLASMVNINFLGERAEELFINPTMGVNASSRVISPTTNLEYTVPLWVSEGSPQPASFSFVDFLPKPSKDGDTFLERCASSHNSSIAHCRNKVNTRILCHQKSDVPNNIKAQCQRRWRVALKRR